MAKKNKIASGVNLFLIIAIVILLNLLARPLFKRFDISEEQIYSLSDVSKRLVKDLDDKLIVKAYFTKDLPPPYNQSYRYLKDKWTNIGPMPVAS